MEKKLVIAIDGPAASGKSTTARLVAQRLGYLHIDTGAMYRAITLRLLEEGIPIEDADRVRDLAEECEVRLERANGNLAVFIADRDVTEAIRSPEVTRHVSAVSSYPAVREVLVRQQRRMAEAGGVVLEGRDIGTVVLPSADLKIFMVADVKERARRRKREMELSGTPTDVEEIRKDLEERDRKDSHRPHSPLRRAEDAIILDTSNLTVDEQVAFIVERANEIIARRRQEACE